MNELLAAGLAWATGGFLGAIFYGGLWWTVRIGISSKRPALLFLGSFIIRTGIVLAGIYFVCGAHWQRLLFCALGFVMAQWIVTRLTRSPADSPSHTLGKPTHAP